MVKKRSIQQKSEDESKGVLQTLFKDWIVNPLDNDFGFDFDVRLTKPLNGKTQEVSEISFYVQNKSSIKSFNEKAVEHLDTDDWLLFQGASVPVLIVKYDIPKQEFYWEIAQDYLWDKIEKEDPNWRRRKTKTLVLTKKIKSLGEISDAIISCQKRITRHHSLNLGIGEGITIDQKDLSKFAKVRERMLFEYKVLSLKEAYYLEKSGDKTAAVKLLNDVYTSPQNDEAKLRATIGLIFELDIFNLKENEKAVELANEAIKLAENLNTTYLKDYSVILRDQAILFLVLKRISQIQLGLKVQEVQVEQALSFGYYVELAKLNQVRLDVVKEINDSLLNLISNKHVYYYLYALAILIDSITGQVMMLSVFNKAVIEQERNLRKQLIEQTETATASVSEIDLKKSLLRSLANYYYWTQRPEKAVMLMSEAINLAETDNDKLFVEKNHKLFERMKEEPDPYKEIEEASEVKNIDEMTVEEYQEMTRKLLLAQGIPLEGNDGLAVAINMALKDMNPKQYFQFCEQVYIGYVNTSFVGASIGLPSMGTKIIWCEHCKHSIEAFDLRSAFESFKQENCTKCTFHKSRTEDWVCYVKWVKDQQQNLPRFKEGLERIRTKKY